MHTYIQIYIIYTYIHMYIRTYVYAHPPLLRSHDALQYDLRVAWFNLHCDPLGQTAPSHAVCIQIVIMYMEQCINLEI